MGHVGFVGLGVMGEPMARHLIEAGHAVAVWNRTRTKMVPAVSNGAVAAPTLAKLGSLCDIVFICVNRTEDVEECLKGLIEGAKPGTMFVDHSTIAPEAAKRFHSWLKGLGFRFMDAPITGGSMGAQKGQLTIFCGGEQADFDEAAEYMRAYAKRSELVGGPGSGQMLKVANQIAVACSLLGLCESLAFAKKAGLDLTQTRDLLSGGAAGSWAFDNYGPKILREDWNPGFSVVNQRKDLGYCEEAARELGASVPGTRLVNELLKRLEDEGRGHAATAELFRTLLELSPDPA